MGTLPGHITRPRERPALAPSFLMLLIGTSTACSIEIGVMTSKVRQYHQLYAKSFLQVGICIFHVVLRSATPSARDLRDLGDKFNQR
jgi:hypothetical protein